MKNNQWTIIGVGVAVIIACLAGLKFWLGSTPGVMLEPRLTDFAAEALAESFGDKGDSEEVDIEGTFVGFEPAVLAESGSWPMFRGASSDNIQNDGVALAESWPESGPPELWAMDLGEGHAGAAVFGGRVFVLDYDEELLGDSLRCFSLADGTEFWRRWYAAPTKRNHGVSRTVPAVTERYTVTIGPRCFVMCVDTDTGDFRWGIDMVREYGTEVPLWYTGQCPLIDGTTVVLAPSGGKALMIGVDCETGEVLWETPNAGSWEMSHSSVIPMTLLGQRTYVYCAVGGICGVSAEPGSEGELLWSSSVWSHTVTSPSPVAVGDGKIFVTAGYGGGSMMLGLEQAGDAITVTTLFELDKTVFGCEQQTPVYYDDHLFGILPKDASALRRQFVCLDTDGKVRWTSGKTQRFGLGPFLIADNKILILDDNGELTMLRASLDGYEQLARYHAIDGHDAWAPMAIVDGLLLLRDSKRMVCLDLRATSAMLEDDTNE